MTCPAWVISILKAFNDRIHAGYKSKKTGGHRKMEQRNDNNQTRMFTAADILNAAASAELAEKVGLAQGSADSSSESNAKTSAQPAAKPAPEAAAPVASASAPEPSTVTEQPIGRHSAANRISAAIAKSQADTSDADDNDDEYDDYDDDEFPLEEDDTEDADEDVDDDGDYDDESDELFSDSADDSEEIDEGSLFTTPGEYLAVPRIPEQYRASDIIGKRQQASGKTELTIGRIGNKAELRAIWDSLTDVEKYIMMLISEHRHMTHAQLSVLIVTPSKLRKKKGAFNNTKSYYEWVTKTQYGVKGMNYKEVFNTQTPKGLTDKLDGLCAAGLLEKITPSYSVNEKGMSQRLADAPALFTDHYYLTVMGAKVLICNTEANKPGRKEKPVGFVPSYRNAAYQSILHEAETTEVLCSLISCASYVTNPDDGRNYGLFDVCRFYHEKAIEEKNVTYKGKKIVFKTDGKLTMYVDEIGDFIDWYIEYDAGSSKADSIKHKTEAFIKYIFWQRERYGERFRKPVLLLVTQKPSAYLPQLTGRKRTPYTTGIKNMAKTQFGEYLDDLNDIAIILVSDCTSIREQGAMGACWHKIDLTTGIADEKAYDLIAASKGISEGIL